MNKENQLKQNTAITLIALVITIIVLLILSAVTLNIVIGENGLFNKAKQAKEKYQTAQEVENNKLSELENEMDNYVGSSRSDLEPELLWTNSATTSSFTAQTIELNLTNYKYVIIVTKTDTSNDWLPRTSVLLPTVINSDELHIGATSSSYRRYAKILATGINFTSAKSGESEDNEKVIPYKIYGIKGELGINVNE